MEAIPLIGAGLGLGQAGGLFGGSGSKTQSSSTPRDLTSPWFQQLGQTLSGNLGSLIAGGPSSFNSYSGPLTASIGANENNQLAALQQSALNPQRQATLNNLISGQFLPGGSAANPYLNATIEAAQRPTMEALQNAVGRQIPGMFAAAGQQAGGSTAKDLQQIRASEIGGRALGDIATGISNNAYNTGFQGMLSGVQLQQNDIQAMLANLAGQGLGRNIQDQGISRAIQLGQQDTASFLQSLGIAAGLPLQTVANSSQSTGNQSAPSSALLSGLFGNQGAFPGLNAAYGQNSMFGTAPKLFG